MSDLGQAYTHGPGAVGRPPMGHKRSGIPATGGTKLETVIISQDRASSSRQSQQYARNKAVSNSQASRTEKVQVMVFCCGYCETTSLLFPNFYAPHGVVARQPIACFPTFTPRKWSASIVYIIQTPMFRQPQAWQPPTMKLSLNQQPRTIPCGVYLVRRYQEAYGFVQR